MPMFHLVQCNYTIYHVQAIYIYYISYNYHTGSIVILLLNLVPASNFRLN